MAGDFDRLYARIFYAGVYRHAVEVQKVADNPERGLLGQSQLLDCCYHAGAAVEQLIYGLLIENGELNRLWSKPFRGENCFILPFHSSGNNTGIIGRHTRNIGNIIDERNDEETWIDFTGNVAHGIKTLLKMRNKAVHENLMIGGSDDVICRFEIFRDYVRREYCEFEDALKAIYPKRSENPFANAEQDLFREWLLFHKERHACGRHESAALETARLSEEKDRIRRRWEIYRNKWNDNNPVFSSCRIGICRCPICGENTTYSGLTGKYCTYWLGEPNNSPSALYCPEEKYLECMCCIAENEEAMHWTNLEIRNYKILHGSLPEDENLIPLTL